MKQLILLVLFSSIMVICNKGEAFPELFVSVKVQEQQKSWLSQLVVQTKASMNEREQLLSLVPKKSPLLEDYKKQHYLKCEFASKNGLAAVFSGSNSNLSSYIKKFKERKLCHVSSGDGYYDNRKYTYLCFSDASSLIHSDRLLGEDAGKRVYLRVIVMIAKRGLLDWFNKMFIQDGSERDTHSSCYLMQGFVCDSSRLEEYREKLVETLDVSLMYHYKEETYERIGLSDISDFVNGAGYLRYCEDQGKSRNLRKLFKPQGVLPRKFLFKSEATSNKRVVSTVLFAKNLADTNTQHESNAEASEQSISPLSERRPDCQEEFNPSLLSRTSVDEVDDDLSISSCSSSTRRRYIDQVPTPLCLPVHCPEQSDIVHITKGLLAPLN